MIKIIDVSKKFRIYEDRSRDFKETTINLLRGKKRSFRELWALREIRLEIMEGETVAFIGENGSGKSTLLKLLAGIYAPDEGKIITRGKISALLELGVGFHPDLTGEENIYLNGAMLGFDHKMMRKKFDEIVAFSEIGDFIYSPIRTYSSGMIMRLGFSIATCVDPDLLLVDEILAVGDEAFQEKCLDRMREFKEAGKTIIVVTHSMELVQTFCDRAILLHKGRLMTDGRSGETVDQYYAMLLEMDKISDPEKSFEKKQAPSRIICEGEEAEKKEEKEESPPIPPEVPSFQRHGTFEAEITNVLIRSEKGEETDSFVSGEKVSICLHVRFHEDIENPNVGMAILRNEKSKMILFHSINTLRKDMKLGFFRRNTDIEVEFIQRFSLPEGEYYLTAAITDPDSSRSYDWQDYLKSFRIKKADFQWEGLIDLHSDIIIHLQADAQPFMV